VSKLGGSLFLRQLGQLLLQQELFFAQLLLNLGEQAGGGKGVADSVVHLLDQRGGAQRGVGKLLAQPLPLRLEALDLGLDAVHAQLQLIELALTGPLLRRTGRWHEHCLDQQHAAPTGLHLGAKAARLGPRGHIGNHQVNLAVRQRCGGKLNAPSNDGSTSMDRHLADMTLANKLHATPFGQEPTSYRVHPLPT
jgi:hypothetical protein